MTYNYQDNMQLTTTGLYVVHEVQRVIVIKLFQTTWKPDKIVSINWCFYPHKQIKYPYLFVDSVPCE